PNTTLVRSRGDWLPDPGTSVESRADEEVSRLVAAGGLPARGTRDRRVVRVLRRRSGMGPAGPRPEERKSPRDPGDSRSARPLSAVGVAPRPQRRRSALA